MTAAAAATLDEFQIKTLRHKRHIISSNIILEERVVADLLKRHLITDGMLDGMKV